MILLTSVTPIHVIKKKEERDWTVVTLLTKAGKRTDVDTYSHWLKWQGLKSKRFWFNCLSTFLANSYRSPTCFGLCAGCWVLGHSRKQPGCPLRRPQPRGGWVDDKGVYTVGCLRADRRGPSSRLRGSAVPALRREGDVPVRRSRAWECLETDVQQVVSGDGAW